MLGVMRIPQPSATSVRCQQRAAESQGCRVLGRLAIQLWHKKDGNLEEGGKQASLRLPLLKHFLLFLSTPILKSPLFFMLVEKHRNTFQLHLNALLHS